MTCKVEETVFGGAPDILNPIPRHPDGEHVVRRQGIEQWRRDRWCAPNLGLGDRLGSLRRWSYFFHPLAHFHDLDGAGLGMRLDAPPRGPVVGLVVVVDIAEQKTRRRLVDDDPDVGIDPDRPEIGILRLVDAVELQSRSRRVELQVERSRLRGLLLLRIKPGKGGGERIGDAKFHA